MRRNFKITILLLIGIAGLISFAVIRLLGPTSAMVGLGLQSYTNASAVVAVTNLSCFQIDYVLKVERKSKEGWPKYEAGIPLGNDAGQTGVLYPKHVSMVTVPAMVYAPPYPWRLSIFCYRRSRTPSPNTIRFKTGLWAILGMCSFRSQRPVLNRIVLGLGVLERL